MIVNLITFKALLQSIASIFLNLYFSSLYFYIQSLLSIYCSNGLRLINFFLLPTDNTKVQLGLSTNSLSRFSPIFEYSAASFIVKLSFAHSGQLVVV